MNLTISEIKVVERMEKSPVTIRDLFDQCMVNSPTKIISNLRRKGLKIADEYHINPNTKSRYKYYFLGV